MVSDRELILAALLHDVGKLGQRAHRSGEGLGGEALGLAQMICPSYQGHHTHRHVLYTAEFILTHLGYLPPGVDRERLNRLAAWHHLPCDDETGLIARADRLSSGMERESEDHCADGADRFRKVRLRAITNEIALAGREPAGGPWSVELNPLSPELGFAVSDDAPERDRTAEYKPLWDGLLREWNRNRVADPWGYLNRALSVLERYTWCVPSDTTGYPDISLFDHLKTTAAIAISLAQAAKPGPPFLLVTGDLSGIQGYLFGLHMGAGGLARRLRARSLFISLVTDSAVHYILRRLGLPLTQCILSAGGRFTLLLPNTAQAAESVQEAAGGPAEWSAGQTGFALRPHIATLAATEDELRDDFGALLLGLRERLEREKARPLRIALVGPEGWREERFVQPPLVSEDEGLCTCCGRAAGRPREEDGEPVCDACHRDDREGRGLVKARYIAFLPGGGRLPFASAEMVTEERDIPRDAYLALDLDGGSGGLPGTPVVGRFIARHVPLDGEGNIVEFTALAARSRGRTALAYLKADVDNLGLIFGGGLRGEGGDRRSISRLATLSRSLELFFGGHVQALGCEKDIYTVYSGGDDLLVIGPWSTLVQFAVRLREDFARFTCGNPSWGLSAGLAVAGHHTPVLTAAEETEDRLHGAKHTPGPGIVPWPPGAEAGGGECGKDRLVAMGTSIPWDYVPGLLADAERLLRWLEDEKLSTGQVRRLLSYADLYQEWQRTGDMRAFRYAPLLVYDLKRNWANAPPEALEWARELTLRDSAKMPALRFICEYALYGARGAADGSEAP